MILGKNRTALIELLKDLTLHTYLTGEVIGNFNFGIPLKVIYQTKAGNQIDNIVRLFFVDQMDVDKVLQTVRVEVIDAKL